MYDIAARMTNDEDLSFRFYVLNNDDSVPADFGSYQFELVVRNTDTQEEVFVLANSDGLTPSIPDGSVTVFLADHGLDPGTRYSMGCRFTAGIYTKQVFTGGLTIEEGNFR